jgi:surface carbohydrate biosynthesis protein
MEKINVLFPIEVINRDLEYRLFLAVRCAHPRNRIFIGQHDAIFRLSRFIDAGIYLGQYVFRQLFPLEKGERYRELKERGFSVIHLHEEGAVFYGGPDDWAAALRRRVDPTLFEPDDHLCTWGDFQRDTYRALEPRCADNIRTTGHPRFDLYRPEYRRYYARQMASLRRPPGRFILVNTNLVLANNCLGPVDTFSPVRGYYADGPADARSLFFEKWAHNSRILTNFVTLVNRLSVEFPDLQIVLRPHPAENHGFYRTVFRGIPNITVVHEGTVAPWIFAAELLIHNGCTTGMEACLSGKRVINFLSVQNPKFDLFLPNVFGERCTDEDQVVASVRTALRERPDGGQVPLAELPEQARELVSNFDAESFPRVASLLSRVEEEVAGRPHRYRRAEFQVGDSVHRALARARGAARSFFPERLSRFLAYSQIFYGFDRTEIGNKLDAVQRVVGKRVKWEYYGPELISIEADAN